MTRACRRGSRVAASARMASGRTRPGSTATTRARTPPSRRT